MPGLDAVLDLGIVHLKQQPQLAGDRIPNLRHLEERDARGRAVELELMARRVV